VCDVWKDGFARVEERAIGTENAVQCELASLPVGAGQNRKWRGGACGICEMWWFFWTVSDE
jgi:hypothetical protein